MKVVTFLHDSVFTNNLCEATLQAYPNPKHFYNLHLKDGLHTLSPIYCVSRPRGCQTLWCHHQTNNLLGLVYMEYVRPWVPFPCKACIYFLLLHGPRYSGRKSWHCLYSTSMWWWQHSLSPILSPSLHLLYPYLVAFLFIFDVPYHLSVPPYFL